MEPDTIETERHRRTHGIAIVFFALTFFLLVETIGPEKILHIETGVQAVSNLEASILPPPLEDGITPVLDRQVSYGSHIPTPQEVRGMYITGWTAGTTKGLQRTLDLFEGSVLNAVVIDIKDATGRLSYQPLDPELVATGVGTRRISNLSGVIQEFHDRGIYVIGRLTVFQDPFYAAGHPEDTFVDIGTGDTWKDYKGIAWLRPDSLAVGQYTARIAHDAYAQGFDEINVDYVRYPSDGDLKSIDLSHLQKSKAETIQDFFVTLDAALQDSAIPLSADVFGLTMSASNDVGIGQKAVLIAPSVDALAPMLYPSHFWNGTYGIPVPAAEPYRVIYKSLSDGIAKLDAVGISKEKLRPWFQDFDLLGVPYTADMVHAQIQAARDLGINSWLMWDPRNTYTKEVYTR